MIKKSFFSILCVFILFSFNTSEKNNYNKVKVKSRTVDIDVSTCKFKNVTDSVLVDLYNNKSIYEGESTFVNFFKISKECSFNGFDDMILKMIKNHFEPSFIEEYGVPIKEDFVVLKRENVNIGRKEITYLVLKNNFGTGAIASPSMEKIFCIYSKNNKLITFFYCDDFEFNNATIVISHFIRNKTFKVKYSYNQKKNIYIFCERKIIED